MGMISKTLTIASALAIIAMTGTSMAAERDHDDRGTRLQAERGALILQRGGWDGNGPDMFGTVEEDRGTRVMYRSGRGGWDANGPDSAGAADAPAEFNLDALTVEAIKLPDGRELYIVRD
jgi:hypothetical protein